MCALSFYVCAILILSAPVGLWGLEIGIIFRHILPNASPIIIANLPFLLAASITTLTALDFLGLGLPIGSPSLGELLAQGKNNLTAWWLGITGFVAITMILIMLVFIGEAVRDAFDVRKN